MSGLQPRRVSSGIDLIQARIVLLDPVLNCIDLAWINSGGPSFVGLLLELPVMAVPIERKIKRLRFDHTNAAASHCVVEHPIDLLPWSRALIVGHVVEDGCISIFAFERAAEERPKCARNI